MKKPSTLLFWIAMAVALILLAPYAGVHILTSPPAPYDQEEEPGALLPETSDVQEAIEDPELIDDNNKPGESLDEIKGLLAE